MLTKIKFDLQLFGTLTPVDATEANTHISKHFGKLLEPGLRKIFFDTYNEVPEEYSKVYRVETSSKAVEHDWGMGAFGDWTARKDELDVVDYAKVSPGDDRTYTHKAFTKGFKVGRELADDDQYNKIAKLAAGLAFAGRASIEKDAFSLFKTGFTVKGYDGSELFAKTHKLLDSVKTCSNLMEGPLTRENLKKGIIMMREQLNEAGNLISVKADKLIIPPSLEDTAVQVLDAKLLPDTGFNNSNKYMTNLGLQIVVCNYLGEIAGGSDTAWFLQDSRVHQLTFFWRIKPEFKSAETFDDFTASYRGYMRYSFGYSDWRGMVGSKGEDVVAG